jgi:hypothetical protein
MCPIVWYVKLPLISNDCTCGCNGFKTDPMSWLMRVPYDVDKHFHLLIFSAFIVFACQLVLNALELLESLDNGWNRISWTIWKCWKMEIVGKVGLDEVEEIWKIVLKLKTYSKKTTSTLMNTNKWVTKTKSKE